MKSEANSAGLLKFIRYGFAPNLFSYCGPRDYRAIQDYLRAEKADSGLRQLVQEYTGASPYLEFISQQNNLSDPFDIRVVEAYWLGNTLLNRCDLRDFYVHIQEKFKKRVSRKTLQLFLGIIPQGARPHHSFHVLQIFARTGGARKNLTPTLSAINHCLIRAGRILSIDQVSRRATVQTKRLVFQYQQLVWQPGVVEKIKLGALDASKYRTKNWISFHWGWACEKISFQQKKQLDNWTNNQLKKINNLSDSALFNAFTNQ